MNSALPSEAYSPGAKSESQQLRDPKVTLQRDMGPRDTKKQLRCVQRPGRVTWKIRRAAARRPLVTSPREDGMHETP